MIHKGANRYKVVVGNGEFSLPPEYQRVEYIEGTGTQWIDTGIKAETTYNVDVKFILNEKELCAIYGAHENGKGLFLSTNQNGVVYANDTSDYIRPYFLFSNNVEYVVKQNDNNTIINNIVYNNNYPTQTQVRTLLLFARRANGSVDRIINGKIFYFKLYDNDTPVRNMIPCYRHSDGVAGMYDTVNDVFYTNQGTGSFVVGNNVYGGTFTVPKTV